MNRRKDRSSSKQIKKRLDSTNDSVRDRDELVGPGDRDADGQDFNDITRPIWGSFVLSPPLRDGKTITRDLGESFYFGSRVTFRRRRDFRYSASSPVRGPLTV